MSCYHCLVTTAAASHVNNVALGKHGRWRSNVWTYPGASSLGSDARRGLEEHPTVKPTAMLEDALLDLTNRGDIVVDPFLGSGSTPSLWRKTGIGVVVASSSIRADVDVIVRRYQAATGAFSCSSVEPGETFEALAIRRALEQVSG